MPPAGPQAPLHSGCPQKLYQLAGFGVHQLRALAPVALLWTPSCSRYLNDLQVCICSARDRVCMQWVQSNTSTSRSWQSKFRCAILSRLSAPARISHPAGQNRCGMSVAEHSTAKQLLHLSAESHCSLAQHLGALEHDCSCNMWSL